MTIKDSALKVFNNTEDRILVQWIIKQLHLTGVSVAIQTLLKLIKIQQEIQHV